MKSLARPKRGARRGRLVRAHVEQFDQERNDLGPDYHDGGWLFCWENGTPPHPDTITRRFKRLAKAAGLPAMDLHDVRHSYREVTAILADLIVGGLLVTEVDAQADEPGQAD